MPDLNNDPDPVALFEGYLAREDARETGGAPEPQQEQQAETEEVEAEAQAEGQETPPEEEVPEEGADDERGTPEAAVAPDDLLYTVNVDGKQEQLPVKELARGYLREASYT